MICNVKVKLRIHSKFKKIVYYYIDLDFAAVYPNKENQLFNKWENFLMKIEKKIKSDLKDCETSLFWKDLLKQKSELNEGKFMLQKSETLFISNKLFVNEKYNLYLQIHTMQGLIHCLHVFQNHY